MSKKLENDDLHEDPYSVISHQGQTILKQSEEIQTLKKQIENLSKQKTDRERGYYWVEIHHNDGYMIPLYWDGSAWEVRDHMLNKIDENIITEPDYNKS